MALVLKDRVKETSAVVGTGTLTLLGAETGYQSFAVIGDGNSCYYTIQNVESGFEGEWEAGIGTYTSSGTTLSRDDVLSSSNGGTLVDFSAGDKIVFVTYPAERAVALDEVTESLLPNQIPFTTASGYVSGDDAFEYSQALNQAKAPVFYSVNGISVYSTVISYNYTLPENTFAVSFSPIATANGVSITVPSGQSWTIAVNPYA
jgi:hypothetical protein